MSDTFYTVDSDRITAIADAIRLKRDIVDEMTLDDMPMQIGLIDSGSGGVLTGTVTPEANAQFTIDVGTDNFTHFLFIAEPLPETATIARQLYGRYADFGKGINLNFYGPSSAGANTINASRFITQEKNGSIVTEKTGVGSTYGTINVGDTFAWYAW